MNRKKCELGRKNKRMTQHGTKCIKIEYYDTRNIKTWKMEWKAYECRRKSSNGKEC